MNTINQKLKYVAYCSFGKDSVANIILAKEHNEPLDEVVYCEVMFNEEISGEIPEHRDFIYKIAKPMIESWGIKVTVLRSEKTYMQCFNQIISRGKNKGKIHGFPLCNKCMILRDCKLVEINKYKHLFGQNTVDYIGLAADEYHRLNKIESQYKISLLNKYGINESETFNICRKYELLSPIYTFTGRSGCWFCPNAKKQELKHLYEHHPDLWEKMLDIQKYPNKVTEKFNRNYTFDEIDYAFKHSKIKDFIPEIANIKM